MTANVFEYGTFGLRIQGICAIIFPTDGERGEGDAMVIYYGTHRALKESLLERGLREIHMHDTCSGQYFTIDEPDDATCDALCEHFSALGARVVFNADRTEYTVVDGEPPHKGGGGAR